MNMLNLDQIVEKSLNNDFLDRNECHQILSFPNQELNKLLEAVYIPRKRYKGNKVSIQILSNIRSGNCSQNCNYCAQSCVSSAKIDKYYLLPEENLLNNGEIGRKKYVKRHCVGVSGITFADDDFDKICDRFKKLREAINTDICCSIGFLTKEQAIKLKKAGVKRINHNLNTSKNYYENVCTTHKYEDRIKNINMLKSVGFEICCGGIIGMGESNDDIIDMLFDIKTIAPESVPINFLIPIKGTPFENMAKNLSPEFCIKVLCLARFLNPKSDIRSAAGREIHINEKQNLMFYAVNSIFAAGYLTADGQSISDAIELIENSGFEYEIE